VGSQLEGKVAVITGAGGGLGLAHAKYLAQLGASVVVNDVQADAAKAAAAAITAERGGAAEPHTTDISSLEGGESLIAAALERFGGLDIVVNNAGIVRDKMIFSMDEKSWGDVIRVHGSGTFSVCRAASAYFRDRAKAGNAKPATVVNTSSEAGLFGNPGQVNYTFAKAGIVALTLTMHMELGKYDVRCNVVCPRARTAMLETLALPEPPTGGIDPLDPRQVSPLVAYLASEASAPISGQVFAAFGGQLHHLRPWSWGESFAVRDRLLEFEDVAEFCRHTFEHEAPVPPLPRHAQGITEWAQAAGDTR
jgi:NAD(P)-dependent dehydrogenase (short-subunit alcohol dehydrogenase family)